jgi:hypothetical protein
MRHLLLALPVLVGLSLPASGQVSIGIGIEMPGISIGINMPAYPQLQRVPGYPVYYAPQASANYFFYDGVYWVFQGDDWYASHWYNGPWRLVGREVVPLYVLRVPVRYYRHPPGFFRGWRDDAPPRWGEHWGPSWQNQRRGWDQWDRRRVPAPVALPVYQREYRGERYPGPQQQRQVEQREWQRRDGRDNSPRYNAPPQRPPAYERPQATPPRARPEPPERARPPERSNPPRAPERNEGRGNDRGDRGGGRDDDRRPQRGQDRGNDRGPDRKD